MSDSQATSIFATRAVKVGVYDADAKEWVTEVTLPPGSAIIVGSDTGCTVPLKVSLLVDRDEIVSADGNLCFRPGNKLQLTEADDTVLKGDVDELAQKGVTSPTPVRWHKMNVRIRPSIAVFVTYQPPADAG